MAKNCFMPTTFLRFLSYLLHPIFMPTYLFGGLFFFTNAFIEYAATIRWSLWGFLFLGTCGFPVLTIFALLKSKAISSLEMTQHKERRLPFILVAIFYTAVTFLVARGVFAETLLAYLLIAITQTVCVAAIINIFYKLSMHSVGVAGALGILFALQLCDSRYDLFFPILLCVLLVGVVLSTRLALQAHSSEEVLVGATTGLSVGFGGIWWLLG